MFFSSNQAVGRERMLREEIKQKFKESNDNNEANTEEEINLLKWIIVLLFHLLQHHINKLRPPETASVLSLISVPLRN